MSRASGFVPPVYPFDRLKPIEAIAESLPGGMVDLSVGTPCDPPPPAVIEALATSGAERGYPAAIGSARLLDAARHWVGRRFGVELDRSVVAACIGTKEFVAGVPQWLRLRSPERDTVLYPSVAYPTYEMGALLASCRAVPVPPRPDGSLALETLSEKDASRALCLWLNSPSNPTGALDDLDAAARWGRAHGVPVLSDECYAEYTWDGAPRTVLETGIEGVLAVHSISKRSNCAGLRVGFYCGDPELVHYLVEVRRHAGFMVPGPIQLAGAVALEDDEHVALQRARYRARLERFCEVLELIGVKASLPGGSFYLWIPVPEHGYESYAVEGEGPEWAFTRYLATTAGVLVSPGDFYGPDGVGYVRIAMVQPDETIELAATRLEASLA
ncbi:MAG TPA: aminotransferase class I/II-fold pyridoxal phosphate-dependent enzyme [Mycobacteriales bacterium]|nr:aminotransferase class I/II-fold pyridoxal phosphate-dependent enzyme [Mycobacteriales bacterium]